MKLLLKKLNIVAAGLFNLKGLEAKLASAIASSIAEAILQQQKEDPNVLTIKKAAKLAKELFNKKYGYIMRIRDIYPNKEFKLFKDEVKEKYFKRIILSIADLGNELYLDPPRTGHVGEIRYSFEAIIRELIATGSIFEGNEVSLSSITSTVRDIVSHELRHAVDSVFNPKDITRNDFSWQKEINTQDMSEDDYNKIHYYNSPTELKSWAGGLAQHLFRFFKGDISQFNNKEVLQQGLTSYREFLKYLTPRNKKKFMTRVYNEFQRLQEANFGKEEISEGKFIDPFQDIKEKAQEAKNVKEFIETLFPHWDRIKEDKKSYKYLESKDLVKTLKKDFPLLKAGRNPEFTKEEDLPLRLKTQRY
jgi:hypothetical protein